MRIGLDLDGVLFDFVSTMRRLFPSIPADPAEVDLTAYLNPVQQTQFYQVLDSPQVFGNLPLIPGMESLIPYLNSQETYVITSRNMKVHEATRRRIYAVGLRPQGILFKHNKTKAVRDYSIDVFIDDQPKHVAPLPPEQVVLMPDLGYNREFAKRALAENKMVFQYHNPQELYDFLKKLEGVAHHGRR